MHTLLNGAALVGMLAVAGVAQTIILPQQAATTEGSSSTPFPWSVGLLPTGSVRVQNIYNASNFTNQGVNTPILINQLSWRANGFTIGGVGTFPTVEIKLSTATPGAVGGPNATFANNHGGDVATVYPSAPVTLTATAGTSPNGFCCTVNLPTPFLYVPAWGDLCVDVSNQGGAGVPGQQCDQFISLGAGGSRLWDTTPNATVMTSATGQSQPGVATVMRLGYTVATGVLATNASAGIGCGQQFTSFYQDFVTPGAFDLSNSAMTLTPLGNGAYAVTPGGAFLAVGSIGTPTTLTLTDDSATTVPLTAMGSFPAPTGATTDFTICSNGWVSPVAGNSTLAGPTNALVLNAPQTLWCCWHDYDPTAGGAVVFEDSPAVTVVTWDNVRNYAGTTTADDSTWQMQFYPNGNVVFAWQTMSANGNGYYVGYSPGGVSENPGSSDLSARLAAGGFTSDPVDALRLSLAATSRPVIGSNWGFTLSNIPATGLIGVDILGLSNPGIPDLTFLGLPTCGLYSSLDLVSAWGVPGVTRSWNLALPNNPVLVNVHLFLSNAIFQVPPINSFGATTSNSIDGRCGNL